jgi:hypothetical protein
MYFFIRGSQRLTWWPKWTPDSSRFFMVTTATISSTLPLFQPVPANHFPNKSPPGT